MGEGATVKATKNHGPFLQAKDISDAEMVAALDATAGKHNASSNVCDQSCLWYVEAHLPQYPAKVVLAKLRRLIERGIVEGCGCGCRGDFKVVRSPDVLST